MKKLVRKIEADDNAIELHIKKLEKDLLEENFNEGKPNVLRKNFFTEFKDEIKKPIQELKVFTDIWRSHFIKISG